MDEQITILIEPGDQGWWLATVPELPGTVSQGETVEEARDMVLDCLKELMAYRRDAALQNASSNAKIESIRFAS